MKTFCTLFLAAFVLFSCNNDGKTSQPYRQKSVGNINALQVVMTDELWNGLVGEEVRTYFAAPTDGLPQEEPIFSIRQMEPSSFSGFAKASRIFLHVSLGSEDKVSIATDSFARPQVGGIIVSNSEEGLIDLINENHKQIIEKLRGAEIKERQKRTRISKLKIDSLKERLGLTLEIPSAYRVAKSSDDFYWIRKDLKSGSTNILIYEVPLNTISNDSSAIAEIIAMRDNLSGDYMPVEDDGRFITEEAYAPYLFTTQIDEKFAYETKGTWEVKDQYMAGPFLNYAVRDEANNRYLIMEGFTYAPSVKKRNLQFELESILKSAKIGE